MMFGVVAAWRPRQKKTGQHITLPIAIATTVVVVVLAVSLIVYLSPKSTSNTVFCGMLRYAVFPAVSVVGGQTVTENLTETSVTSYTTNTSVAASVGRVVSTLTTYSPVGFNGAGNVTICTYISRSS